eukprot:s371_g8.t1
MARCRGRPRLRVEHLHPSEVTWNAAMEACGDAWQLSLELLREMEEQRSEVNILALASAVSSLHGGRAGDKLAGQLEELRTSALCRSRLLAEPQMDGWPAGWLAGWLARWMDGWMDGWIHGMHARMDGWMDGWVGGWVNGWMEGGMDGWMDSRDAWMDGWMDG